MGRLYPGTVARTQPNVGKASVAGASALGTARSTHGIRRSALPRRNTHVVTRG
jgi:hypothetical protein